MTEDHGLSDGDNSIECAQSYEFIVLPLTVVSTLLAKSECNRKSYTENRYS